MRSSRRRPLLGCLAVLVLACAAAPAGAVEYRLKTVSILDSALYAFLSSRELEDGASGPGLDRLQSSLDKGEFPAGALLYDRPLQPVADARARAYAAAPVRTEILYRGMGGTVWDEARWEGKPGERSVWVVSVSNTRYQELRHVGLKGSGPLKHFQPQIGPINGKKLLAVAMPLNFLWAEEERGVIWSRWLAGSLDLSQGLGAVVGVNHNSLFVDVAYLIVENGEKPTTYTAVLGWRRRIPSDRGNVEGAGGGIDLIK